MAAGGSGAVDAYLAALPDDRQAALGALRTVVRRLAPGAAESLRLRMPTYDLDGFLCAIAAQKRYLAFYLCDAGIVERQRPHLSGLDVAKGCVRFKHIDDLPLAVVERMLKEALRRRANTGAVTVDKARGKLVLPSGREIPLKPEHLPLTKRFSLGLTDRAYTALRDLAAMTGLGNNYVLTVLLENADKTVDRKALQQAVAAMMARHGKSKAR